ncbi:MAG: tRNA (adenosine(37)-N6)-dimethylallyltransferase MiaA [Rhodobiaceae bacterium]|nr:tRNA (adenosine(37)-N6)-dimethylallyltransferase MiaA [Rhodobiaceae bacterium]|tara:strand:- start:187 stop:1104 length:918 start_codon:yes stop_codon:yes gene_type:complete
MSELPILIAGATASGKSALALALAEKFNGCVINADSMQVYGTLNVLTARPPKEDLRRAPHRLYGHVPVAAPYSVGQWQAEALAAIDEAQENGQCPILVGGTGLYFKSLIEGLADIPDIPDNVRDSLRARLDSDGLAALYAELQSVDGVLAERLPPTDSQRILRGLEVFEATGEPLSQWQKQVQKPPLTDYCGILLMPDRDWLYARCNARYEAMLAAGAQQEVEELWALNLPPDANGLKALGVGQIMAYLQGEIDAEVATAQAQQATRRYAKRQMTWFRNQMSDWKSFSEQDYENNFAKIFSFISK